VWWPSLSPCRYCNSRFSLPPGTKPDSALALARAIGHTGDSLVSYVVSFYVIGQFWLDHHRVFRFITGHGEGLARWNFGFLFTITLFPFSSALLGHYPNNSFTVIEFAINLLLASMSATSVIGVAKRLSMLDSHATPTAIRGIRSIRLRGAASAVAILLSIWSPSTPGTMQTTSGFRWPWPRGWPPPGGTGIGTKRGLGGIIEKGTTGCSARARVRPGTAYL